ncbi:hypothetical protein BFP76_04120 [Amylibacter kogurei]|uniref:Capsular biosynthesis protein n=1 Tax=Paramylibacter kogurei TaxID=1889778 RepID=A0A2G5K5V8_9RHOB|nr:capsular polysaccharide biosynthesis protein [Amylibacter kogurei]PIB24403.1 hypothetical protein BFP76_04120 [Amylibacter kogurei]
MSTKPKTGQGTARPRLYVYSLGLVFRPRIRRILRASGWSVRIGIPRKQRDSVGVWGRKRTYRRGRMIADWRQVPMVTIEDGFVRSIRTGRQGEPSLSVIIDKSGVYFDTGKPSELHDFIVNAQNMRPLELERAKAGIQALRETHLTKYNANDLSPPVLPDEFVLVIDQTRGDASITLGGGDANTFASMLLMARTEHPDKTILIKTHPETNAGKRKGHFQKTDIDDNTILFDDACSPWHLFDRASAIYCVTSQMGLEAIFAGKKPIVFGRPFYAGWGLSDDRNPDQTQHEKRSAEQLFWAAYLRYTRWYDPYFDRASDFFKTAQVMIARRRAWIVARKPIVAYGMRLWKRGFLRRYLSAANSEIRFSSDASFAVNLARANQAQLHVWAGKEPANMAAEAARQNVSLIRVEDGFLRSGGLGAALVRPASLVFDDLGIYYDPKRESRLEHHINHSAKLNAQQCERARKIRQAYVKLGLSKYNLDGATLDINPTGRQKVILIPGQVEDDASILTGAGDVRTNKDLVWATRQIYPNDYLIYKPHPDVAAGLRKGVVEREVLNGLVNKVATDVDIASLLGQVDRVATITSLTGFEALLHGKTVICFGMPFYAGWGLTDDQISPPSRRIARPNLDQLVHASLIDYPMYWDPVTGAPCPIETVVERFENKQFGASGFGVRMLAKLQGVFASYAYLWR